MNAAPFFEVQDAAVLAPFGTCVGCGVAEDPMVAIFWATDECGNAHCPGCSGQAATEGYDSFVVYLRTDRGREPPMRLGPYSPAEAARVARYLCKLENVDAESVRVAPPLGVS
jgi:hypothetical protein